LHFRQLHYGVAAFIAGMSRSRLTGARSYMSAMSFGRGFNFMADSPWIIASKSGEKLEKQEGLAPRKTLTL
jgi:hypothetical protein